VDRVAGAVEAAMVPLMMATLALAVASQIGAVSGLLGSLLLVVPVFVVFAVIMLAVGIAAGRLAGLDVPATRALALSGVTRNSLVVLPLALATPFALAPLVVVTQTLVELLFLVGCVRLLPRLVPAARGPS
jgi:ACR3 family arsenite efflux pump ArsB